MKIKCIIAIAAIAAAITVACTKAPETTQQSAAPEKIVQLDREALVTLMKNYLDALVKHDPKAVPFAEEVQVQSTKREGDNADLLSGRI